MFSRATNIIITASLAMGAISAHAAPVCEAIFPAQVNLGQTESNNLDSLARLLLRVDEVQSAGGSSAALSALKADYLKKENALAEHLVKSGMMTAEQFRNTLKEKVIDLQNKKIQQVRVQEERKREQREQREREAKEIRKNVIDGTRAVFHKIEPGSFKMGAKKVDVTLTKPFEMMATPTTQMIWKVVAMLANSHGHQINENPSKTKGELYPVESVSYSEVQTWLTALNEMSKHGEPFLKEIILGHKDGDQYRLPTEAEWEYMARGGGRFNVESDFVKSGNKLKDYGYFAEVERGVPYNLGPVATKLPIEIAGKEFFDIFGNNMEWVADGWSDHVSGGVDPFVKFESGLGVARGYHEIFSFSTPGEIFSYRAREKDRASRIVGFRIVREVKE